MLMLKHYLRNVLLRPPSPVRFCSSQSTDIGGKILNVVVTSLRVDRVVATAFGIGRGKVEYGLLSGLVKLNGDQLKKKSVSIREGDILDLISEEKTTPDDLVLSRLKLLEIGEKTKKGNINLTLYRNKMLKIGRSEYTKSLNL